VWYCSETCKNEAQQQHQERLCAAFKKTSSSKKSQGKHSMSLLKILFKILDRQIAEQSTLPKQVFYKLSDSRISDYSTTYNDVNQLISNKSTWTTEELKDWK
jgi:hypothetical protein